MSHSPSLASTSVTETSFALLQKRRQADLVAKKKQLQSINAIKALRKVVNNSLTENERQVAERKLAKHEKLVREGVTGIRLGKHFVPKTQIDVQLGEDLTETLRELKVCFNSLVRSCKSSS